MSLWVNIIEDVALVSAGATICYGLLWWKGRDLKKLRALETESLLAKARTEAEIMSRDARLAASEEARKIREQTDEAAAARRTERLELERRLAERESLINSQLSRILEVEKSLGDQKQAITQKEKE